MSCEGGGAESPRLQRDYGRLADRSASLRTLQPTPLGRIRKVAGTASPILRWTDWDGHPEARDLAVARSDTESGAQARSDARRHTAHGPTGGRSG